MRKTHAGMRERVQAAPLQVRMLMGFAVLLGLGSGQSLFAHWTATETVAAVESQQRHESIARLAGETRSALLAMEAGYGGYLLMGDKGQLETYTAGANAYAVDLAALEVLSANEPDPEGVTRWQDLERRGVFWQHFSTEPGIAMRGLVGAGSGSGQATLGYVAAALSEHDIVAIENTLNQAITDEEAVLQDSRLATLNANARLVASTLWGTLLVLGVGGLIALLSAGNLARAISRVRAADRELAHQALHDPLTGLPNRALLRLRLKQGLDAMKQNHAGQLGLLLFDLDRFKEVNDTLGHEVGDDLLKQIGQRVQGAVGSADEVACLGGDEFVVLLADADVSRATAVAEDLVQIFQAPFMLEGQSIAVNASIGIALAPTHAQDPDSLLRFADIAMYQAKRAKAGPVLYQADQDRHSTDKLVMLGELRTAIDSDQLLLHYQPKLDLRDGALVGVEALVRWQHPQRGFLSPDKFIPLAEQSGLIHPLTLWVLETAMRQQQAWRAIGMSIPVAVNLSRRTLHDARLHDTIAELLARWDALPSALVLEITESSLMADPVRGSETLMALRTLGVVVSIDDFGTGYSSLDSLKNLSVDELKIDRSFVQAMAADSSSRAIVRAIIDLADALNLRVVAEGVEDRATWDVLASLGCDMAQGYFLSPPLAAHELELWIKQVGPSWLEVAALPRAEDPLQGRIRGRGARLTAEEEFVARKHAEAALHASEERNRLALQAAGMGTWVFEVERNVWSWSAEMEAMAGLLPGTFERTTEAFQRIVPPDDWAISEAEVQASLLERRDSSITYRMLMPDGSVRWIEGRGRALYADDGTLLQINGTSMDITKRKVAEQELQASEERFRKQYKGFPLPTFSWLQEGDDFVLQDFNDAAKAVDDGDINEWIGERASKRYADRPELLAYLRECVAEQHTVRRETRFHLRRTGVGRDVAVTYVFVPPQTAMVHVEDITEAKRAEQQREAMAQSEKLRALGQMASGIAHDLNQSLMLVASYSDLASQALVQDPQNLTEIQDLLTTTTQAALDGGETVKRLLQFTHTAPEHDRHPVNLAELVRHAAQLTAPRWRDAAQAEGRPISLHIVADGTPTIEGSSVQLRELMTNLIFNAVDALPTGGSIRIRVVAEGGKGILEVADSGVGMAADVQARVFEPFFTTKGEGGTGLGLAMVFGTVKLHGGQIEVQSARGAGTTFRIEFPLLAPSAEAVRIRVHPAQPEPTLPLRILAVDDEPMMTKAVVRMLKPSGHMVSIAASGEEAIAKLGEQRFDVVLSDMGMGAGMNGWELADAVKHRWPDVRFLLATGWGAAINSDDAEARGVDAVLAKPYQLADLLRVLAATDEAA